MLVHLSKWEVVLFVMWVVVGFARFGWNWNDQRRIVSGCRELGFTVVVGTILVLLWLGLGLRGLL